MMGATAALRNSATAYPWIFEFKFFFKKNLHCCCCCCRVKFLSQKKEEDGKICIASSSSHSNREKKTFLPNTKKIPTKNPPTFFAWRKKIKPPTRHALLLMTRLPFLTLTSACTRREVWWVGEKKGKFKFLIECSEMEFRFMLQYFRY